MVSVVVGSLCLLTSCTSDAVPDAGENGNEFVPVELTAEEAHVSERMNNFAIDLLTEAITANDNSENIAISPLGAVMVAGMFGNAINPSERGELLDALGINDLGGLNSYCSKMLSELPEHDNTADFVIANGAWFDRSDVALNDSYRHVIENDYKSDVAMVDFNDGMALGVLNSWIKDKTAGMIPGVLDELDDDEYAVWLNAVYFKGVWKNSFEKADTKKAVFTREDGTSVSVDMMSNLESYVGIRVYNPVFEAKGVSRPDKEIAMEVATMDYGNGGFSLTAIMPGKNTTLKAFATSDMHEVIGKILRSEQISQYMDWTPVKFPKFDMMLSADLIPYMKALGLNNIFSGVEMSGIGKNNAVVSQFRQKISVEVDEEGTKTASSTTGVGGILFNPIEPVEFNRPFVYFIWEKSTGTILLAGTVMDPTK